MKKSILTLACMALVTAAAYSQTQSLSFNDNVGTANAGTYNPTDSIIFDVSVTYSGYTSQGLSYWLEVPLALAPNISVTGVVYNSPVYTDSNQTTPNPAPFTASVGASSGFRTENRDLGATEADTTVAIAAGTYQVNTLTLSLVGAAPGTYTLQSTVVSPHTSEVSENLPSVTTHNLPASIYTITIVPEPATWSLIALGGLGAFGLNLLRARRRSRS